MAEQMVTQLISRLLWAGVISLVISLVVNFFWKISLHMTAMGGIVGLFISVNVLNYGHMPVTMILSVLLAGVLASSRLCLGNHNMAQVFAGFAVGFCIVSMMLLF